jgi:hypothetical protein
VSSSRVLDFEPWTIHGFHLFRVNHEAKRPAKIRQISPSEIHYTHPMCNQFGCRRRLCSQLDEKDDSDEGNNYQGGGVFELTNL